MQIIGIHNLTHHLHVIFTLSPENWKHWVFNLTQIIRSPRLELADWRWLPREGGRTQTRPKTRLEIFDSKELPKCPFRLEVSLPPTLEIVHWGLHLPTLVIAKAILPCCCYGGQRQEWPPKTLEMEVLCSFQKANPGGIFAIHYITIKNSKNNRPTPQETVSRHVSMHRGRRQDPIRTDQRVQGQETVSWAGMR